MCCKLPSGNNRQQCIKMFWISLIKTYLDTATLLILRLQPCCWQHSQLSNVYIAWSIRGSFKKVQLTPCSGLPLHSMQCFRTWMECCWWLFIHLHERVRLSYVTVLLEPGYEGPCMPSPQLTGKANLGTAWQTMGWYMEDNVGYCRGLTKVLTGQFVCATNILKWA